MSFDFPNGETIVNVFVPVFVGLAMFFAMTVESSLAQVDRLTVDKDHIVGVIEAHITNLEGWQSGDYLIRIQEEALGRHYQSFIEDGIENWRVVEGADAASISISGSRLYRVMFDIERERVFVAGRGYDEQQLFDGLDSEIGMPKKTQFDSVFLLDRPNGIGASRLRAAQIHKMNAERLPSVRQILAQASVPDIRVLGCHTHWGGVWADDEKRLPDIFNLVRDWDSIEEITHVGENRYKVFSRHDLRPDDRRFGARYYLDWDVAQQVPVAFSIYSGYRPEDFKNSVKEKAQWSGNTAWKIINGVSVPVSTRAVAGNIKRIDGRVFDIPHEITVDIHWFSVNEELPKELFQEDILHDRKKVDELLDETVFADHAPNSGNDEGR